MRTSKNVRMETVEKVEGGGVSFSQQADSRLTSSPLFLSEARGWSKKTRKRVWKLVDGGREARNDVGIGEGTNVQRRANGNRAMMKDHFDERNRKGVGQSLRKSTRKPEIVIRVGEEKSSDGQAGRKALGDTDGVATSCVTVARADRHNLEVWIQCGSRESGRLD